MNNTNKKRIKDLFNIKAGGDLDGMLVEQECNDITPYPIYANSAVNSGIYGYTNNYKYNKESITVTARGNLGVAFHRTKPFNAIGRLLILLARNKNINLKYINYILQNNQSIGNQTAIPQLTAPEFGNQLIELFEDYKKQTAIANYLDQETSKIDRKISILEQKYEKLEEYKQSVIFETVTKGLDSSVQMKDSGIVSIGMTPNEWIVSRIKDLFEIGRGRVIAATEVEKEKTEINSYPVYSAATENNGIIGYINTFDFNQPLLTWTTDGAKAGTIFIREGKFNCTNVCGTLIAKNKQKNLKFYKYALEVQTPHYKRADINGAKIMNNEMAAILITEPSSEQEQNAIVHYLDTFTSKIDKKVEIIKKQIDLLKEYKQTIIYEAVTGKMEIL